MRILTPKQLAEYVIPEYELAIREGKKDSARRFLKRLSERKMERGVCWFLSNTDVDEVSEVVHSKIYGRTSSISWGPYAVYSIGKKEMVEALQLRIDILRKYFLK